MKWSDLYTNVGTYISPVYDVSSMYELYESVFHFNYNTNDGKVNVYVRLSFDGTSWGEWTKINDVAYDRLFVDDFYNLESCKFQYKVEMSYIRGNSPTFSSFSASLSGGFLINNLGDVVCKPELWIKKRSSSGDVRIINESNGQILEFKGLNNNETVYIDCENQDIMTDLPLTYRYDSHNDVFLELEVGENILTGEGEFDLDIRCQFKTLQG
ncbi:phage tail family protein [Paenibacillus alvei]|uniref:phage tail family protein n=2 Tax=Paenibacillus alvei TaxID=44250 RepID=UPI0021CF719C|nr:phage tail family protein [Paenibacillus alvei]MCY9707635.1 phage tail family protein [Paenibacillus alvei]MEC0082853.1 phage tail family protein [Paenibacillus alvei]